MTGQTENPVPGLFVNLRSVPRFTPATARPPAPGSTG